MCAVGCHGAAEELRPRSDRLKAPLIHSVKGRHELSILRIPALIRLEAESIGLPALEFDKIGHIALPKVKEAVLAVTGR
jgi:hypothetical protein